MPVCRNTMLHTKTSTSHNSLPQDIAIFNEHDSTKLEEWLMDIETVADLTVKAKTSLLKQHQHD